VEDHADLHPDYWNGLLWQEVNYILSNDSIKEFNYLLDEMVKTLKSALGSRFEQGFLVMSPRNGQQNCLLTLCAIRKLKTEARVMEGAVSMSMNLLNVDGVALINLPNIPTSQILAGTSRWTITRATFKPEGDRDMMRAVNASRALMPVVRSMDTMANVGLDELKQDHDYYENVGVVIDYLSSQSATGHRDDLGYEREKDLVFPGALLANAFRVTEPALVALKAGETEGFQHVTLMQFDQKKDVVHFAGTDRHTTVIASSKVRNDAAKKLWVDGKQLPTYQMFAQPFTDAFVRLQERFGQTGKMDVDVSTLWRVYRAEVRTRNGNYSYQGAYFVEDDFKVHGRNSPQRVGFIVRAPMVAMYPNVYQLISTALACSFVAVKYSELVQKLDAARRVIEPIRPPKNSMDMSLKYPVALFADKDTASLVVPKDNVKGSSSRAAVFPFEDMRVTAPHSQLNHGEDQRFGVVMDAELLWDALGSWGKVRGNGIIDLSSYGVMIGTDAKCSGQSPVVLFSKACTSEADHVPMTWATFIQPLNIPQGISGIHLERHSGWTATTVLFDAIVEREDLWNALLACESALGHLPDSASCVVILWMDNYQFHVMSSPLFTYGVNDIWHNLAPQDEMLGGDIVSVGMPVHTQMGGRNGPALVPLSDMIRQLKGLKGRRIRVRSEASTKDQNIGPTPKYISYITDVGEAVTADGAPQGVSMEHESQPWQDRKVIESLAKQFESATEGHFHCRVEGDGVLGVLGGIIRKGGRDATFGIRQTANAGLLWLYAQHGNDFSAGRLRLEGSECKDQVSAPLYEFAKREGAPPITSTGFEMQLSLLGLESVCEAIKKGSSGSGKKRVYPRVKMGVTSIKLIAAVSDSEIAGTLDPELGALKRKFMLGLSGPQENAFQKARGQKAFLRAGSGATEDAVKGGIIDAKVVDATRYGEIDGLLTIIGYDGEGGPVDVNVWSGLHHTNRNLGFHWLHDPDNPMGLAGYLWKGYSNYNTEIELETIKNITQPAHASSASGVPVHIEAASSFGVSATKVSALLTDASAKLKSLGLTSKSGRVQFDFQANGDLTARILKMGALREDTVWEEVAQLKHLEGELYGNARTPLSIRWTLSYEELRKTIALAGKGDWLYVVLRRHARDEHDLNRTVNERSITTVLGSDLSTVLVQTLRPLIEYGA